MKIKAILKFPHALKESESATFFGVRFCCQGDGALVAEVSDEIGKILLDGGQAEKVVTRGRNAD